MFVPTSADLRPGSQSCSLWYIAGRLGYREKAETWLVAYVSELIAGDGFPPPLPLYRALHSVRPVRLDKVTASHRWNRDAVDAWFDGTIPPPLVEARNDNVAARFAAQLDARANAIAGAAA
jgi:hypothetical protein